MNPRMRSLVGIRVLATSLIVLLAMVGVSHAGASDSAPVIVIVGGGPGTVTPSPTSTSTATATATNEPNADTTPTIPAVSQLPETGVAGSQSATSFALMTMMAAGFLLTLGALVGSRRRNL